MSNTNENTNKIEMVRELTEQSTENYKVYLMSDGSQQMVFTPAAQTANQNGGIMLLSEDSEMTAGLSTEINVYKFANGIVSQLGPDFNLEVGNVDGDVRRVYINFSLSELPRNPRIKKVELCLPQTEAPTVTLAEGQKAPRIALYMLTSDIVENGAAPTNTTTISDFERLKLDGSEYRFDITRIIADSGTTNVGFVLRLEDESAQAVAHISDLPTVCVNYQSNFGVNTGYRACTQDLGFFGQGSVDLGARNLTFECTDFAWAGNRMPVTLKHLYTSALSDLQYKSDATIGLRTAYFDKMNVGLGWRLNLMQSMTSHMIDADNAGFIYVDEDGAERVFKECTYTLTRENETQYTPFECDTDSSMLYDPEYGKLTMGDEEYSFDSSGRLIQIQNSYGDSIDITYQSNLLKKITDGVGREFDLEYNDDGYLIRITAPDGSSLSYTYSAGRLTSVTYPTGERAEITYYDYLPRRVNLVDKNGNTVYSMQYIFSSNNVTETQEFGFKDGVEVAGAHSVFTNESKPYRMKITTTQPAQSSDESDEVTVTYYTFDDDGNVVGEYMASQNLGNVGVEDSQNGIHPISDSASQVTNVTNLLTDHSFENEKEVTEAEYKFKHLGVEEHSKFGKSFFRAENTADVDTPFPALDATTLPAGEYTFSAYVKPTDNFEENCGAYLAIALSDDEFLAQSEKICEYTGEYMRLVLPFTLTEETTVYPRLCVKGVGVAYFDGAQLENNPFVSPYNMLVNGNFELGESSSGEALFWRRSDDDKVRLNNTKYFSKNSSIELTCDLDTESYIYQDIKVKSAADTRETFTLGGWAQGYSTVVREREDQELPRFCLKAEIFYKEEKDENGEDIQQTEMFTADFTPGTRDWQFASVSFSKSEFKEVEKLRIYCDYSYNTSMAYFDDIFLIRDSIETDLTGDDFGSQSAETTDSKQNDIDTMREFPYPEFEEMHDGYGNNFTETTFTDGEFGTIYRSLGYTDNSNELEWETDARGNHTEYSVYENTSLNKEVIDRCGDKTIYNYDKRGRVIKVTNSDYQDRELAHVSYSYDAFDNLYEIVRGDGMKYVLNYNAFHNLESIGIDGKTDGNLISYTYKNGSGRLKELSYANGDKMKATYNSYGQLVSETWTNAAGNPTAKYKYSYDAQGNIARTIDILAEKEYTYTYEDGVLVRAAEYSAILDNNEFVTGRELDCSISYIYEDGELIRKHIKFSGQNERVIYYNNTDNGNNMVKFSVPDYLEDDPNHTREIFCHSKQDSFGRKEFDEIQFGVDSLYRKFTYHEGAISETHLENEKVKSEPTTQLVKEIKFSDGSSLAYEYDEEERITSVVHKYRDENYDETTDITEYAYDSMGELITERVNGVTKNTMRYYTFNDEGEHSFYGNIQEKNGVAYVYDSVWKDKLIQVGNKTISYDAQGNPINYMGTEAIWTKGRQLAQFGQEQYFYNANGIRTAKIARGNTHNYTLEGTKILSETWTDYDTQVNHKIVPMYDGEDSVCGIVYDNTPYYFQKNLQGDIIAIVDASGHIEARYTYDAWGVPTVESYNTTNNIAYVNPFRYRGYYYDTETDLYYLQSRYYDPATGRFINGDEVIFAMISTDSLEVNMVAYCTNNPVTKSDLLGFWAENYSGFSWTSNGFNLNVHSKFLSRGFCMNYAKNIIQLKGQWYWWGRGYKKMDAVRIAEELWFHAIVYYVGSPIKKILNKIGVSWGWLNSKIDSAKYMEINNNDNRAWVFTLLWCFAYSVRPLVRYYVASGFPYNCIYL